MSHSKYILKKEEEITAKHDHHKTTPIITVCERLKIALANSTINVWTKSVRIEQFDWSVTGSYLTFEPPWNTYEPGIMRSNLIGELEFFLLLLFFSCESPFETCFFFSLLFHSGKSIYTGQYCNANYTLARLNEKNANTYPF